MISLNEKFRLKYANLFHLFLLICFAVFLNNCGKKISVSMVTSTSSSKQLPFVVLQGDKWEAEPDSQYVKVHMYLDEVVPISGVQVESCSKGFTESISVFINFDEFIRRSETGKNNKIAQVSFDPVVSARSVTINFGKNEGICLASIHLLDNDKKKYKVQVPKVVQAEVTASETSRPYQSYDVMNMFDSRYEYAYASAKGGAGVFFDFKFKESIKIESVKLWNGYQRSDIHCVDNGRVKTLQFEGDDGYNETIQLEDELGSQTIQLPKPYKGKNLKMTVKEIFKGRKYQGFLISELRFFDGKQWILPDPSEASAKIASQNREEFTKSGLVSALNHSLEGGDHFANETIVKVSADNSSSNGENQSGDDHSEDMQEEEPERSLSYWIFRFRSDGSFFLEGNTSRDKEDSIEHQRFFALGNYEVVKSDEKGMNLKIFGFLRNTKTSEEIIYGEGDCNGCGRDCNKLGSGSDPNSVEKIFSEVLEIKKNDGKFFILNKSNKGNLDFGNLELSLK
jgi:hypothetical protein